MTPRTEIDDAFLLACPGCGLPACAGRCLGARFAAWWALVEGARCPTCQQPMTLVQAGKDVHADPCGHCLYEGRLPEPPREEPRRA